MFQKIAKIFGGDPFKKDVQDFSKIVQEINALEPEYEKLSNEALRAKTDEFRQRVANEIEGIEDEKERQNAEQEALDDILPEAFAAVREASKRTIGLRHYDVQMIGGIALHSKRIAEMRTGEGKTLVATLPLYLNALTGRGVHLVTVNDYLARRDARWMAPIYDALGLRAGVLQMASRTENGKMAFLVDLEKRSPKEDQDQLVLVPRQQAYLADIVYGTNSEFGFDYLRDNLTNSLGDRVQRGHYYAIVDEVDNILIDEARTPLIISGPASEDVGWYAQMAAVVRQLRPEDYEVNEKDRSVSLTELGEAHVEELLAIPLRDPERPEDVSPEQARLLGYLEQSMRAQYLFHRNKDYLVQSGKVIIVDEFTGRLMPGRRWSDGLHQAIEAKENVKVEPENVTYATITIQNYFRMYEKLAGMTGTALTEAEEFYKIYKLDVLPIPTNLEYMAEQAGAELLSFEAKDEQGYKFVAYARRDDPSRKPIFWKRQDYPDVVYRTEEAKIRSITLEIIRFHIIGRPQLIGTTSVEHSERLADRLAAEPIRRLLQVQLIRDAFMKKNKIEQSERAIPELMPLNKPLPSLEIGDLRAMVRNLKLDITLGLEDPANLDRLVELLELTEQDKPRLVKVLQGGIQHQVLNARKHDEESMIIARAGAFGAVTIATNMAGRGVDIKLGGDLPEELLADVVRVLRSAGYDDPYEMTNEQRKQAVLKLTPEQIGIYEEPIKAFLQYLEDMVRVRQLGGLHVVGSERHEARRIDNQLRGRSARQGDPGSSRFYLSLEDELMRLFGGAQAEGLFKRLNIDEGLPIESGIIGRLVEQSQERVEGSNFDVRKHLLEYDDVLNEQRKRIYSQRDRVFTKEDLSEDVLDMLRSELQIRIPKSLKDDEGPWKLLAYLDEIQPPIDFEDIFYPTYNLRLLLDEVRAKVPATGEPRYQARDALMALAESALLAEKEHVLRSTRAMLEKTQESLEAQRQERFDTLDTYFEGLENPQVDEGEAESAPRRPQEILDELQSLVRAQLRLSPEQMRRLADGDSDLKETIQAQIDAGLLALTTNRLLGAIERRLEESIGLKLANLAGLSYEDIGDQIMQAIETTLNARMQRLLGEQGQIAHDLDPVLERQGETALEERNLLALMQLMATGARLAFDRKTHRQGWRRYNRLNYTYLAARLLENRSPEAITEAVVEHLEGARASLERVWGRAEWLRLSQQAEVTFQNFDERLQNLLADSLGRERFEELSARPINTFSPSDLELVSAVLGKRLQNEIYRQLLLGVISEQWVDYLTKVEALRVSIGLEAYAQRNPLVEYKGRASEMFRELLSDIRQGVIARMFTTQPRRGSEASVDRSAVPAGERLPQPSAVAAPEPQIARGTAPQATPQPAAPAQRQGASAPVQQPQSPLRQVDGHYGGKKKRKRH